MSSDSAHDAMVAACISAAEHIDRSGSRELRVVSRMMLYLLGTEIARQEQAKQQGADGAKDGGAAQSDKDRLN